MKKANQCDHFSILAHQDIKSDWLGARADCQEAELLKATHEGKGWPHGMALAHSLTLPSLGLLFPECSSKK